jgi:hypothetical protein
VDAHVAAASPVQSRGRIQGMYTTVGLFGAAVGASALTVLYAIDFRLPLFALGAGYGLCVLAGGLMVSLAEARGLVMVPAPGGAQRRASVSA